MREKLWMAALAAALVAVAVTVARYQSSSEPVAAQGYTSVAEELGEGELAGYARVTAPRPFDFPRDHGPHPEFKHEWWYYTGNLFTPEGRRFGFQLTFFRIALRPEPVASVSAWRDEQIYMAHFALSDIDGGRFHHAQRLSRGALELAGAHPEADMPAAQFAVWLEDWQVTAAGEAPQACVGLGSPERCQTVELAAAEAGVGLRLRLASLKPLVLQGEAGLSQKSAAPGNASFYYSMTRLLADGEVMLDGERLPVRGSAWLDREWSTSVLGPGQTGWDWFALQLADGAELMYYRMRRSDGVSDPHSAGIWVGPDAVAHRLAAEDVQLQVADYWTSPHTGVRYPARWRLQVPRLDLRLEVAPALADQELTATAVQYWEGAVDVQGTAGTAPIRGVGYVELAGYADEVAMQAP